MFLSMDKQNRITIPKAIRFRFTEKIFYISNKPGSTDTLIFSSEFFDGAIKCKFDDKGRFFLPSILRKSLKINAESALEITNDQDGIIIKIHRDSNLCVFCESDLGGNFLVFQRKKICIKCLHSLKQIVEALPN